MINYKHIEQGSIDSARLKHFFKQHKQAHLNRSDEAFIAELDGKIIGAVRLESYQDYYWLRNLFVEKRQRSQGIGRTLIQTCNQFSTRSIYLFPLTHLEQFYISQGYYEVKLQTLPEHLLTKLEGYHENGKKWRAFHFISDTDKS